MVHVINERAEHTVLNSPRHDYKSKCRRNPPPAFIENSVPNFEGRRLVFIERETPDAPPIDTSVDSEYQLLVSSRSVQSLAEVTRPVALEALNNFQKEELGVGYRWGKAVKLTLWPLLGFGTALAAEVAVSYFALLPLVTEYPSAAATALVGPATVLMAIFRPSADEMKNRVIQLGALLSIALPLWIMMKAAEGAKEHYDKIERVKESKQQAALQYMKENLESKFAEVAATIKAKLTACEDSAKQTLEIRGELEVLQQKMPEIEHMLLSTFPMESAQIVKILQPCKLILDELKRGAIALKTPSSLRHNKFNAEFLAYSSIEQFKEIAIPSRIKGRIISMKENTFGWMYKVRCFGNSIKQGVFTAGKFAIGGCLTAFVTRLTLDKEIAEVTTPMTGMTVPEVVAIWGGVLALVGGVSSGNGQFAKSTEYGVQAAALAQSQKKRALTEVQATYDGIASYLETLDESDERTDLLIRIKAKLPLLNSLIQGTGIEATPGESTGTLAAML